MKGNKIRISFWVGCLVILIFSIVVQMGQVTKERAAKKLTNYGIRQEKGIAVDAYRVKKGTFIVSERFSAKKIKKDIFIAEIPLDFKEKLEVGMKVYSDKIRGEIVDIENRMRMATGLFIIKIQAHSEGLSIGSVAIFDIHIKKLKNVISVPSVAVIERKKKYDVWVIEKGKVNLRRVIVGQENGKKIIIKSGLQEKDLVVVHGIADLKVGDKAFVVNEGEL